jgi:DNA-binding NarL/FixJ family response regulator
MNPAHCRRDVVLIVDDTPANLAYLSDALSDANFKVLVAIDGPTALERLNLVTPDIILLDAVMPGMDGFETCQAIKQRPDGRDIPIVFMTGLIETRHVVRAFEQGAIDYVTKPVRQEEVIARIGTHIQRARMLRHAQQSIESCGKAGFSMDTEGNITWQTPRARTWLASCFRDGQRGERWEQLRGWVDRSARVDTGPEGPAPFFFAIQGGAIRLHYLGLTQGGDRLLLLEEDRNEHLTTRRLIQQLGLTQREGEVLNWLCAGKTNRDIAQILGMSPRTVNKHLERIYQKLGIETRSSAVAIAMRTIAGPSIAT